MLTKKHFKAIAEILKEFSDPERTDHIAGAEGMMAYYEMDFLIERFGEYFKKENPLFDEKKFQDACSNRELASKRGYYNKGVSND